MTMTFDLTGKLLISTPSMGDRRFTHSVIYLCAYGSEGAFGLVLNRPLPHLTLGDVLDQIGIDEHGPHAESPVLSGGPVETQRGFVLHTAGSTEDASATPLPGGLMLSASTEILRAIARGEAPTRWLLALGYAGWGPGQLEAEIAQNAWLTAAAPEDLVFAATPGEHQWNGALRSMGVDPLSLSTVAGRA
ncbi:YqgE/AlgH family protein [Pararhodobacter sp.]|uniref:YqgE/AlgH family protein n=1 Tax=Pararhodobacter sp. TaxID=2127056 RepID=UPI002B003D11|nr:YqgE/AlgH family protein [Pararhodobacter sp.]